MEELTIQGLIKANYSGSISDMTSYLSLALQATAVLIGGIVVWRMSNRMHQKKQSSRNRSNFFETTYAKNWKRR